VTALRGRLAAIACTWLCCQFSLLAAAPVSLLADGPHSAQSMACTCVHTGNAQCPMHHPASQKRGCECRGATDPDAATVVSLLGPIAVLAGAPSRLTPPAIAESPAHHITRFTGFIVVPDGPPPRA
jgi:hypothetical protein